MDERISQLEGLQTVETVMEKLGLRRQSVINLLARWRKQGHVTNFFRTGRRVYHITMRKQHPRVPGMWDTINKYSPHMKLNPWYDHQVHGRYGPEEALIDAIQTESFRVILASLHLFKHITDWKRLYRLAQEKGCWQKVGALYDLARLQMKVRRMSSRYRHREFKKRQFLIREYPTTEQEFLPIEREWNVPIPFRHGDLRKGEVI